MKNGKKKNTEKAMMVSALVILVGFLSVSLQMEEWKRDIPVYRPVGITDETEEAAENVTDASGLAGEAISHHLWKEEMSDRGDRTSGREMSDAVYRLAEDDTSNAAYKSFEYETADGDHGFAPDETAAVGCRIAGGESYTEGQEDTEAGKGKIRSSTDDRSKPKTLTFGGSWEDTVEFPVSLRTEERYLVRIFYAGGLRACYCVGATDLNPGECMVYAVYSDGSICRVSPLLFQTEGFSAESSGIHTGKISYQGMTLEISYEVADFQVVFHLNGGACVGSKENVSYLCDYVLEDAALPQRTGYMFQGWYLDEELTKAAEFPLRVSERITHLYAGWKRSVSSYTLEDGTLVLPESCTSIGEKEFWNAHGKIEEIYVGAAVSEILPGAFLGLKDLSYIDVDWRNPCYTTINCGLYTKDGKKLLAHPSVRAGSCRVYEGTEVLGKYAFYESMLSELVLPENIRCIEDFAFGKHLKTLRFQGMAPPESLSREAFSGISGELVIEVPEEALETYREVLGEISLALKERTVGFHKE